MYMVLPSIYFPRIFQPVTPGSQLNRIAENRQRFSNRFFYAMTFSLKITPKEIRNYTILRLFTCGAAAITASGTTLF